VPHFITAFRDGLREAGFVAGQNVMIEFRSAENEVALPTLVADLIRRQVAVIAANGIGALAAKSATKTVPIVFATGSDPVADGLVTSLNRPGGNVTGVSFLGGLVGGKRLELLHQLLPNARTMAMLVNSGTREGETEREDAQTAAEALGLDLVALNVESGQSLEAAFATFTERGSAAVLVGSGGFTNSHREEIVALARRHHLPAAFSIREPVLGGAIMSYGSSPTEAYRQVGIYAGRILRGEKPADLPVMQSTKLDLVLNLKAARAFGIVVPDKLLALADEVIE
jgi:putative ABC transport system substrate-binding protein